MLSLSPSSLLSFNIFWSSQALALVQIWTSEKISQYLWSQTNDLRLCVHKLKVSWNWCRWSLHIVQPQDNRFIPNQSLNITLWSLRLPAQKDIISVSVSQTLRLSANQIQNLPLQFISGPTYLQMFQRTYEQISLDIILLFLNTLLRSIKTRISARSGPDLGDFRYDP